MIRRFGRHLVRAIVIAAPFAACAAAYGLVPAGPTAESLALAKSNFDSPYSFEQTWNSAVRLVRVDLGLKIEEKDDKNGYMLFEYEDRGTKGTGSIEVLKGEKAVRVICNLPKFPSYHEARILDRLEKKLRDEYGPPPEKPKPQPDAGPAPEASTDAAP
jgi:hypothetical protein